MLAIQVVTKQPQHTATIESTRKSSRLRKEPLETGVPSVTTSKETTASQESTSPNAAARLTAAAKGARTPRKRTRGKSLLELAQQVQESSQAAQPEESAEQQRIESPEEERVVSNKNVDNPEDEEQHNTEPHPEEPALNDEGADDLEDEEQHDTEHHQEESALNDEDADDSEDEEPNGTKSDSEDSELGSKDSSSEEDGSNDSSASSSDEEQVKIMDTDYQGSGKYSRNKIDDKLPEGDTAQGQMQQLSSINPAVRPCIVSSPEISTQAEKQQFSGYLYSMEESVVTYNSTNVRRQKPFPAQTFYEMQLQQIAIDRGSTGTSHHAMWQQKVVAVPFTDFLLPNIEAIKYSVQSYPSYFGDLGQGAPTFLRKMVDAEEWSVNEVYVSREDFVLYEKQVRELQEQQSGWKLEAQTPIMAVCIAEDEDGNALPDLISDEWKHKPSWKGLHRVKWTPENQNEHYLLAIRAYLGNWYQHFAPLSQPDRLGSLSTLRGRTGSGEPIRGCTQAWACPEVQDWYHQRLW